MFGIVKKFYFSIGYIMRCCFFKKGENRKGKRKVL